VAGRSRQRGLGRVPYGRKQLRGAAVPAYTGSALRMISFPLGGIGTGTIGLGGRGELRDWEIFNNPNLGYRPPYTMPFLFVRWGRRRWAGVLERQLLPPFHDSHGLPPDQLPGLPRLKEALFVGTYPAAWIVFQDDRLPVEVSLTAFSPMVPLDADASAIPAAVLVYRVRNRTRGPAEGTVAFSMANVAGLVGPERRDRSAAPGRNVNRFRRARIAAGRLSGIHMTTRRFAPGESGYGTMALATTARRVTGVADLGRYDWFDKGQRLWDEFSRSGLVRRGGRARPDSNGHVPVGVLGARFRLRPGQEAELPFLITWSFPTRLARWIVPAGHEPKAVTNHYARRFPDAWTAARHLAGRMGSLRDRTMAFVRALFGSTLPGVVLDAISSQMSTIRTNTTMWLQSPPGAPKGRIFAFEGCNTTSGCCPMNCTHVWNYEQSLAHLYPALERSMRLTDYEDNVHDGGAMCFRTTLPLRAGLPLWRAELPAADGQFGTVVKTYREWRISGDTRWLKSLWPAVRQSIEFAWSGFAKWDADADGVMEGVQHNTYDIEFHGPNMLCGSLYLAALAAGAEMAEAVGDGPAAERFRRVYASGRAKYERLLFNGEYYVQKIVPAGGARTGSLRYQYGRGCLSDQLLGQWAAHVAGLGHILPAEHVRSALKSIFRHNFKPDLSEHASCQRVYALGDEAGLVMCTWPRGRREAFPFPYSDEVWTGVEYQVAAHLIYEGFVDEGLALVQAARARHDGIRRNPWNEFECGDHYARAMSSWSLLLALSGQCYDGRSKTLTMKPRLEQEQFQCLFTAADGYGSYSQRRQKRALAVTVECVDGKIKLKSLCLSPPGKAAKDVPKVSCRLGGRTLGTELVAEGRELTVRLARQLTLRAGDALRLRLG